MRIFEQLESDVRSYIRSFPVVFDKAKGAHLYDENGKEYLDFFAGAGTLNYGHNNPLISEALVNYIQSDGIVHGLDKATVAKKAFLHKFQDVILDPRQLDYKVQFPGPTGTNAVETALKLARMVKNRSNVIAFTNGYHGLTMGSVAVTGNSFYRDEAFINRTNVAFMPFESFLGSEADTIGYLRRFIENNSSGVDLPAAMILETVQAEGGVNIASNAWLQELEQICRDFDILMIIDDIQVGNGRTGSFFSFEDAGINPDIVVLSKSIGGGLPLSLVLMKPELDQWKPGEHTGTFRGNNLAFVAATEALSYWETDELTASVEYKSKIVTDELQKITQKYEELNPLVRGRGLIHGIEFADSSLAGQVSAQAFENGLIIETAGSDGQVVKFLPPLVIDEDNLRKGLQIFEQSIETLISSRDEARSGDPILDAPVRK